MTFFFFFVKLIFKNFKPQTQFLLTVSQSVSRSNIWKIKTPNYIVINLFFPKYFYQLNTVFILVRPKFFEFKHSIEKRLPVQY